MVIAISIPYILEKYLVGSPACKAMPTSTECVYISVCASKDLLWAS